MQSRKKMVAFRLTLICSTELIPLGSFSTCGADQSTAASFRLIASSAWQCLSERGRQTSVKKRGGMEDNMPCSGKAAHNVLTATGSLEAGVVVSHAVCSKRGSISATSAPQAAPPHNLFAAEHPAEFSAWRCERNAPSGQDAPSWPGV